MGLHTPEHCQERRGLANGEAASSAAHAKAPWWCTGGWLRHRVPIVTETNDHNAVLLRQDRLVDSVAAVEVRQHVRHLGS
jgi:hypothetical protein